MKTIERIKSFAASPEDVFDSLDDLGVTGMHMTKSSMPMMGGKLNLEFLSPNKKGLNTKYRWTGNALWMPLDFTVVVTDWLRGKQKSWETVGASKIIICSWFRMNLVIKSEKNGTVARLSISYEKPIGLFNRILSAIFADWYCMWCLKNMLNDTEKRLDNSKSGLVTDM